MKKTILAVATCAVLALATLAPTTADARNRGLGLGLGLGLGIVTAIIVGNALANHPGYYTYDDYDEPAPAGCYWARKAWRDENGRVHYGRARKFCD